MTYNLKPAHVVATIAVAVVLGILIWWIIDMATKPKTVVIVNNKRVRASGKALRALRKAAMAGDATSGGMELDPSTAKALLDAAGDGDVEIPLEIDLPAEPGWGQGQSFAWGAVDYGWTDNTNDGNFSQIDDQLDTTEDNLIDQE